MCFFLWLSCHFFPTWTQSHSCVSNFKSGWKNASLMKTLCFAKTRQFCSPALHVVSRRGVNRVTSRAIIVIVTLRADDNRERKKCVVAWDTSGITGWAWGRCFQHNRHCIDFKNAWAVNTTKDTRFKSECGTLSVRTCWWLALPVVIWREELLSGLSVQNNGYGK